MGRSEQPVPDGPLRDFAEGLRALRCDERLTYRQLSQRARYSFSVLSTAASGRVLPTLEVTLAYVAACKGDTKEWEERWKAAASMLRAPEADRLPSDTQELEAVTDAPAGLKPRSTNGDWRASIEPPGDDGPRLIGAFRILGRLGAGATGEVYLAAGPSGRASAVKVIRPQFARDPLFCRRFAKEVAAARKVEGAHTAAVLDADAHAEQPWMASEFLPGPSLAAVVENQGPLPGPVVLAMAAGICEALTALRAAGVVHRDLKPTNVLLTEHGPKVIDFGIARCLDSTALTATGAQIGTAGFMAPEQAEGNEITSAADVFALGCVLAYAATGRAPFGDGPSASVLYRTVHREPDEEALACGDERLRDLIERCLSKRPEQRPTPEQIIEECAGSTRTGREWLPDSVAAQVRRLDAAATALIKRGERRRAVRRARAASAALLIVAVGGTIAVFDADSVNDIRGVFAQRHAGHVPKGGMGGPEPASAAASAEDGGTIPNAQRARVDVTDTATVLVDTVVLPAPSIAASANNSVSLNGASQTVYPRASPSADSTRGGQPGPSGLVQLPAINLPGPTHARLE